MNHAVYEGTEPYVFISYSHRDIHEMHEISERLSRNKVRFWYDDGLHSGDDWNYSIATHLKNASVCLLLLSPNSADSDYVKNELSFAINHRVPVHTLLLQSFTIPWDIELMIGRVQMVEMVGNYEKKLLDALPVEVFCPDADTLEWISAEHAHPLFEKGTLYWDRQGTKTYTGKHSTLNYPCSIQIDVLKTGAENEAQLLAVAASNMNHALFPQIYDVVIKNGVVRSYQEYGNEEFLDQYLQKHTPSEEKILEWISLVVDGMDYLFRRNWGLRDFARGSLVVSNGDKIGLFRLQNVHYGLLKLKEETKQYYFENELQEIAILLTTLCTRRTPALPLRMIESKVYTRRFMDIVNLVIQKCTREYGRASYSSFEQIQSDLHKRRLSFSDRRFLKERNAKLRQYDMVKEQRKEIFTSSDALAEFAKASPVTRSLEEEFGFDEMVVLQDQRNKADSHEHNGGVPQIRIAVCSTGKVFEFSNSSVIIGRDPLLCDLVWKQPYISRKHLRISRNLNQMYMVLDLNTSNGSYASFVEGECMIKLPISEAMAVPVGTIIVIGETRFQLL